MATNGLKAANRGSSVCDVTSCTATENLEIAPSYAESYYALSLVESDKKVRKLCSNCIQKASSFMEAAKMSLKKNEAIFKHKTQPGDPAVLVDIESDDEEDPEDLKSVARMNNELLELQHDVPDVVKEVLNSLNLTSQMKGNYGILANEIDDLEKELEKIDLCFNATQKDVTDCYKIIDTITESSHTSLVVNCVDIDSIGNITVTTPETSWTRKNRKMGASLTNSPSGQSLPANNISINPLPTTTKSPEAPKFTIRIGSTLYVQMKSALHYWVPGIVTAIIPIGNGKNEYKIKTEYSMHGRGLRSIVKQLGTKSLAQCTPSDRILPVGTRVIAKFRDDFNMEPFGDGQFYVGIVAEPPKPLNKMRYLIFFDDGYAQYVNRAMVYLVLESSKEVWKDVHADSAAFIKEYVSRYPECPLVRLHEGTTVGTEWEGKWWTAKVMEVDCSLVKMKFEADGRYEWIYRGSTRLQPLYDQYTKMFKARSGNVRRQNARSTSGKNRNRAIEYQLQDEEAREQWLEKKAKPVARKSTSSSGNLRNLKNIDQAALKKPAKTNNMNLVAEYEGEITRLKLPKILPKPKKFVNHVCGSECCYPVASNSNINRLSPLAIPIHAGWSREVLKSGGGLSENKFSTFYRAPCGKRLKDIGDLHRYLLQTKCELSIDHFCFDVEIDVLREFLPGRTLYTIQDLTYGKEDTPVQCVNSLDFDYPEYVEYSADRILGNGVTFEKDPGFLTCCDCEDDCKDPSKCACQQLTMSGLSFSKLADQVEGDIKTYEGRRLYNHIVSGIYECNASCRCKSSCMNRVVQFKMKWPLQVFKTSTKGWGVRPLVDIPCGAFICVYAGQILTEQGANEDGQNFGDEYLAELDYIECLESLKEGYESDVTDIEEDNEEGHETTAKKRRVDDDPNSSNFTEDQVSKKSTDFLGSFMEIDELDSDDEGDGEGKSKMKSKLGATVNASLTKEKPKKLRDYFGDEDCYIMDAKSKGNIGRYLNHSCSPNVFVQNVFVDTHDIRFPWVAFFAGKFIKAGSELCWDYNYDIGSVPNKTMYCYCCSSECRGRLL